MTNNCRITTVGAVVLFNTSPDELKRISKIASQVDLLLMVDNSEKTIGSIEFPLNVEYFHNANRGGVSGALNFALLYSKRANAKYLFIFDHDTEVPENYCQDILESFAANSKLAIVGPRYVNSNTGYPGRIADREKLLCSAWPETDVGLISCYFVINSCSVINLERIEEGLKYDERLLVDFGDVDFCLRVLSSGMDIACSTGNVVAHTIGYRAKGSGRWSPTNYSSERKFLQIKSRIIVWRRHIRKFTAFVITDMLIAILDVFRTIVLEKNRIEKTFSIFRGICGGIFEKV